MPPLTSQGAFRAPEHAVHGSIRNQHSRRLDAEERLSQRPALGPQQVGNDRRDLVEAHDPVNDAGRNGERRVHTGGGELPGQRPILVDQGVERRAPASEGSYFCGCCFMPPLIIQDAP